MTANVRVSILIKVLNEEDKITRCLAAAVREAEAVGGEVILVDSLSTDRTVEIARKFPVRIVQFESINDCNCGAATQLGYQFVRGEYLYLTDGDMELQPGFVALALGYLEANRSVAGVGGLIIDTHIRTRADKQRVERFTSINRVIDVNSLGGGGLYRRSAIDSVGYLANRWLKACEEAELGMRLKSARWRLTRMPVPAAAHTGHNESDLGMRRRLWRNGRMRAYGVFLRSALGRPWWWASMRHAWFVFAAPTLYLAVIVFSWLLVGVGISTFMAVLVSVILTWSLAFLALLIKKGKVIDAALAIVVWHLYPIAAVPGFLEKVADPRQPILAREIHHPDK